MGEAVHSGDVPDSGPITTWVTGVSDVFPDSGLLRVLKSALLQGGGHPAPAPVYLTGCFCQQVHQSGLRITENMLAKSLFCSEMRRAWCFISVPREDMGI